MTASFWTNPDLLVIALYGLACRQGPHLEVSYLEVFDVDLVMAKDRGLEGTQSEAVL